MSVTLKQVITYFIVLIISIILFQIELPQNEYSYILDIMGAVGILGSSYLFCKKALG